MGRVKTVARIDRFICHLYARDFLVVAVLLFTLFIHKVMLTIGYVNMQSTGL